MSDFVLPLEALRQQDAGRAGGKAAVLGTLLETGFPVPPGLCVTTASFHAALAPFRPQIHDLLRDLDLRSPDTAATAAANIAALLRGSDYEAQALDGGFPAWEAAGLPVERREQG